MYRVGGFGDSAIPAPVVGSGIPTSSTPTVVPPGTPLTPLQRLQSLLFPTVSGEAGGVQVLGSVAAWGAIGFVLWLIFKGGGSPRRYGR